MAQKRMFDKTITNNDNFLEMPDSTQNLYFHLSMEADDDGFVDNWKSIMRMTGKKEDDLKLLIAKNFVIPFESGVIVIKHWRINNYLRKDRYNTTKYLKEKNQLYVEENQEYILKKDVGIPTGIPVVDTEENRIEENRIEENRIEENNKNKITIFDFIQENFGRTLNSIEYEEISKWEDNELTRYAIKQAVLNNKYSIKYITRILENYRLENIITVGQAQERENNYKNKNNNAITNHQEKIPQWFDKENKNYEITEEEKREMESILNEIS